MAHKVTIDGIDISVDLHESGGGICYVSKSVFAGTIAAFNATLVASGGEFDSPEWQDRKARAVDAVWREHGDAFLAKCRRRDVMRLYSCRVNLDDLQREYAVNAAARAEALAEIQRLRRKLGV